MSSTISTPIQILLLDKDPLVRAGLKLLVECQPGLRVVAQAGTKEEALRLAKREQPHVILLHEDLGGANELEFLDELMAVVHRPRIILVTGRSDSQYHVQAVQKGVVGIVMAHQPPDILYKAIEKVYEGEVWLDRSLIASFVVQKSQGNNVSKTNPEARKIALLSGREREVISLVGEGLKNQQIADQLFLSEVTVRHHLTSIFKKLDVSDRLELVIYAYQNGLARLPA